MEDFGSSRRQKGSNCADAASSTSGAKPTVGTENTPTVNLGDPTITIFQYQTHIEQRDCSVDDDITISFLPFFDTRKDCLYLLSRPQAVTHPESDSFCSLFNLTTATLSRTLAWA